MNWGKCRFILVLIDAYSKYIWAANKDSDITTLSPLVNLKYVHFYYIIYITMIINSLKYVCHSRFLLTEGFRYHYFKHIS